MKYLIACLGNIGPEYVNTRHNIGFMTGDFLCNDLSGKFTTERLAQTATLKYKSRSLVVIKPTTYMNLSGKAIQYWLRQEQIPLENLLVVVDDIALPLGELRVKLKGGDAGHNGLEHIINTLGTNQFARLRFGIGDDFQRGRQVEYVLGTWSKQELNVIEPRIAVAAEIIKSFATIGTERTMTLYNKK
ncbi:MAG: aminoacyl-tRNA hydrolase [Bacteroidetes bacterium HGW-Bacteroidetes-1]|jgi:PTH1 family peptidyl-tRNA hydrolase|nr:MAG: aminoacyl-tRNA hydrolase [Bacteroidetes bacterium HGW-Bacteroidetes-1]